MKRRRAAAGQAEGVEQAVQKKQQRAERILDAAAELVLRWGYKRVTIEEVAKRADIGKGTIYLHWPTREALFLAVMARDAAAMCDDLIAEIQRDPAEILLHRMARRTLLLSRKFPLMQALFSRDTEVLGDLAGERSAEPLRGQKLGFSIEYLELLRSQRLLRTDEPVAEQLYAVNVTIVGFYLLDGLLPVGQRLPLDERAELIARTLRHAFEPPRPPGRTALRKLAPAIMGGVAQLRDYYARFAQGI